MVHRFHDSLAVSESAADEPFWEGVYRAAIPGFVSMSRSPAGDTVAQRSGIDRWIHTTSGRAFTADEKRRGKHYPDVALEVGHIQKSGGWTFGWINKDLPIDFLTYGWVPSQRAIVFPWPVLRSAWLANRIEWQGRVEAGRDGFKRIAAENPTHTTISYAIPTGVLLAACSRAICVDLTAQRRAA
jgi:hypothetical protein